jgi:hypothetical protein
VPATRGSWLRVETRSPFSTRMTPGSRGSSSGSSRCWSKPFDQCCFTATEYATAASEPAARAWLPAPTWSKTYCCTPASSGRRPQVFPARVSRRSGSSDPRLSQCSDWDMAAPCRAGPVAFLPEVLVRYELTRA